VAGLIVLLRCLLCVGTAGLRDAVSPHILSNSLSASHAMSEDAKYSASDLASRKIDAEDGCCTASRTATPQHHAALQAALRAAPRNNKCYHPSLHVGRDYHPSPVQHAALLAAGQAWRGCLLLPTPRTGRARTSCAPGVAVRVSSRQAMSRGAAAVPGNGAPMEPMEQWGSIGM
jgi:hypothetical protein